MSRLTRRQALGAGLAAISGAPQTWARKKRPAPELNVLFISVADLRPELGCYGSADVLSPNIDKLASRGLTLLRNYVQQADNAASRRAALSGIRPEGSRSGPNLPQHFERHGYRAVAHGRTAAEPAMGASRQALDTPENELADGRTVGAAIADMKNLRGDGLFFLTVNLERPALPFAAPKHYFGLYPKGLIKPSDQPDAPIGSPLFAVHGSERLRSYADVPDQGPLEPDLQRELIRAYYASISYMDAQVGRLLAALDDLGLADKTIVALWGDRGYHLGEHGLWGGDTNFENALRTPLVLRSPGRRGGGRKSFALTELVDLFPTLCDLSNVPIPDGLEGSAFTPLFEDQDRLWKRAVFGGLPREIPGVGPGMGRTMRTKRFRYTEWTAEGSPFRAAEVYDYREDPGETRNIVGRPETGSLVNGLAGMLQEGWQASFPPTDPRGTASS